MHFDQMEKSLRKLVRTKGLLLKSLDVDDVLSIAFESWISTSANGIRYDMGDGLVAYFELLDRGRGIRYEFGVNRILRLPVDPEALPWGGSAPGYSLRLSTGIRPDLGVFQLSPAVTTFACWDKGDGNAFVDEVRTSTPFKLMAAHGKQVASIGWSECPGPRGDPEHPSNGLRWAFP
jgi:hypothetical protein